MIKRILTICSVLVYLAPHMAWAQQRSYILSSGDDVYMSRLSEYFYSKTGKEILVPVRVIGNIAKPGLYHIPADTSVVTLMAISGGPGKEADMTNVTITKESGDSQSPNIEKILKTGRDIKLTGGEIIYIPSKEPMISADAVNAISIASGVLGIILTALVLSGDLNKN